MSGFEWFLLVVVVIAAPLVVAVAITLWTLEQAKRRNRQNREEAPGTEPVKRRATRAIDGSGAIVPVAAMSTTTHRTEDRTGRDPSDAELDPSPSSDPTPDTGSTSSGHASSSDSSSGGDSGGSGGDGGSA
jgi:uncharacterized membrane protein YgcG